jgi:hypothetical protein
LFAPVSGFGIVWRGDNYESGDSRWPKQLGWAISPEVSYTITEQGGTLNSYAAGTPYAVSYTYLTLPDGRVISLGRFISMSTLDYITLKILPAQ